MSGIDLSRPSHGELESTLIRFIGFLKAQSYIGVPGKKVSVKIFRNIYNQKFKYALTNAQLGLQGSDVNTHILDPIIGFEPVFEYGLQTGYIEMRPKTFHFARHGITAQRDDVETTTNVDQPKARPPPSLQQQQTKTSLQKQQTNTLPSKQPTQPHPLSQNQQLPAKAISVHSKKLYFVATRFQSGFERTLVGKTLEQIRPVLFYTIDTELSYDMPIKELQFAGYQIFRQLMPGRGGIMVYVNKVCDASYLEDLQSDYFESIWLKLHHPDPVVLEPTSEDAETFRPLTIVGCIRGQKDESKRVGTFAYVDSCVQKLLFQYPGADLIIIGDYPSDSRTKLDFDPKIKSKLVKAPTPSATASQAFLAQWKCTHEEVNIGWQKPLLSPHDNQVFCFVTQTRHLCSCCQISFLKEEDIHQHRSTFKHKKNFQAFVYQNNRSCELSKKYNLFLDITMGENASKGDSVTTTSDGVIVWKVGPSQINQLILGLRNADDPSKQKIDGRGRDLGIVLRSVEFLKHDLDFEMSDKYGFTKPFEDRPLNVKPGIRIVNGQSLKVVIRVHKNEPGQFLAPIFVIFTKDGFDEPAYMIKEILVKVSNSDVDLLQPSSVFVQPPRLTGKHWQHTGETVPGLKLEKSDNDSGMFIKASRKLDHYLLKPTLEKLLNRGFAQFAGMDTVLESMWRKYRSLLDSDLSKHNYKDRFALLLSCEEHQMQLDIRNYDMEKVTMKEQGILLSLEVPGLAENRPSVLKGDRIYVRVYGSASSADPEKKEYEGIVHEVQSTNILVGFSQDLRKRFLPKMRFDVRFTFNRFPIRNMHRAVDIIGRESAAGNFWWGMLFPAKETISSVQKSKINIASFFNKKIEDNQQQRLAVEKIVSGGIPGIPYIIFGPPGTGKTVTIVEAIKQIWRHHPEARLLAVAPSNAAADLLAIRLLDHIPKSQLIRIYAPSRNEKDVPDKLKSASNFLNPASSVKALMEFRVLVVTLVTAGRMASADFPDNHFTHVFIDEAGHAQEPEAIIAVAGIFSSGGKGQLILAGDPKQLGPILRSPIALKYGLQLSLLERLMDRDVYGRDTPQSSYNSDCITKLLCNFRSHPKLLELPSKLFYDSELEPMADPVLTGSLLRWEGLAKQGFPMIFHGVVGEDKREARSPSFFNAEEAVIVVNYLEKLLTNKQKILPSEIGIISPYRRQVQKLRDLMNQKFQNRFPNWQDVTVGSTEEFQGQERKVIIISTVRSQPELIRADFVHKLGFLRNPKRFNVAITRAKALLIVVGNPFLLCMDYHWKQLIHFAKENGGYTGVKFVLSDSIADSPELTQMEEKFRRMGLLSESDDWSEDPDVLADISQKEYVEGQEWRAEI